MDTPDEVDEFLALQKRQTEALEKIVELLTRIVYRKLQV